MALAIVALIVALAGVVLAIINRGALARAAEETSRARQQAAQTQQQAEAASSAAAALRTELDDLRRQVSELREPVAPLPPLPRARKGGLDDLREQLRAAQREAAQSGDTDDE